MASIIRTDALQNLNTSNIISQTNATTLTLGYSGQTIAVASGATLLGGGITWTSTVVTSAMTVAVNTGYFVNTSSNAITVTLPASASVGNTIILSDFNRTWATNALTLNQNSLNFQGSTAQNPIYNTNGQSVTLVYSGATQGWIPTSDDDVTDEVSPQFMSATGGTVSTDGDFKVHTFTSSGDFVVTVGTDPTYGNKVEYLVVGAGGGGGDSHGGGGGGGGYRHNSAYDFTVTSSTYAITVAAKVAVQTSGGSSTFSTITSAGGGKGGTNATGTSGGSGGGGSSFPSDFGGGAGNTPSVSPSQGNNGGSGQGGSNYGCGGGGGASSVGTNGTSSDGGVGGNGSSNDIHGSSRVYSAGGGGHAHGGASAAGGSSNQGGSAVSLTTGGYNVANAYGMGGGGNQTGTISGAPATGNSSQGVVILRYKFQ